MNKEPTTKTTMKTLEERIAIAKRGCKTRKKRMRRAFRGVCINHPKKEATHAKLCQECYASSEKQRRPVKSVWNAVDWTQSNEAITKELRVSVPAVRYQRKKRGLPKARKARSYQQLPMEPII